MSIHLSNSPGERAHLGNRLGKTRDCLRETRVAHFFLPSFAFLLSPTNAPGARVPLPVCLLCLFWAEPDLLSRVGLKPCCRIIQGRGPALLPSHFQGYIFTHKADLGVAFNLPSVAGNQNFLFLYLLFCRFFCRCSPDSGHSTTDYQRQFLPKQCDARRRGIALGRPSGKLNLK